MTQKEKNKILDDFINDKHINWAMDEDGTLWVYEGEKAIIAEISGCKFNTENELEEIVKETLDSTIVLQNYLNEKGVKNYG